MQILQGEQNIKGYKIGVVVARFNREVTEKLEVGAVNYLKEIGIADRNLKVLLVPGAFEIPLAAKALLDAGFDGVVALGAVIRGETTHYDYVCSAAERGCTELQIRTGRPVTFGVLTTENEEQAFARAGGNMGNKGREAAEVCVEMLNLIEVVRG